MDETQALKALSALSDGTRLRMLRFLVQAGADGAAAGEIGAAVGSSPSRSSFHLAALAASGLVRPERVSRRVIYRVDFAALGGLMGYLIEDCCGGHPAVRACCAPTGTEKG
ncbi:helix-turn-helix transcriptional regulator [Psychromarinibacter sp. C21-152]|uniref:Helix-turn-helix transcriptional regulator n=1 Tax=Psychromarinibacter sediminicola TaxID=3033385 RepID=A0AAE3T9S7_9RHOB|nr:helix-turn-helix transcriptional regulator [Psychromarinibacter sediminicola]MDF0600850.1 helix-turn-helix transcriptional regulator [Psychromarinibacter sediminicola]